MAFAASGLKSETECAVSRADKLIKSAVEKSLAAKFIGITDTAALEIPQRSIVRKKSYTDCFCFIRDTCTAQGNMRLAAP